MQGTVSDMAKVFAARPGLLINPMRLGARFPFRQDMG
jgi:hypothetical protein